MGHFYQYHDLLMSNPIMAWLDLQPIKHVMATTVRAVQERERSDKARNDMIEHWKSRKSSESLTERELLATANANVAAGADTVGTELQACVYLLLKNPECLRRLLNELDAAAFSNTISSPVQYDAAQKLPYFQACVS
jgi:cytochrome P450